MLTEVGSLFNFIYMVKKISLLLFTGSCFINAIAQWFIPEMGNMAKPEF